MAGGRAGLVRTAALVAGVALVAVGTVWILQGLDVLKGSFMTGRPFWAWMGALAVLLGLPLLLRSRRR
jgi:hypothetical protein